MGPGKIKKNMKINIQKNLNISQADSSFSFDSNLYSFLYTKRVFYVAIKLLQFVKSSLVLTNCEDDIPIEFMIFSPKGDARDSGNYRAKNLTTVKQSLFMHLF